MSLTHKSDKGENVSYPVTVSDSVPGLHLGMILVEEIMV